MKKTAILSALVWAFVASTLFFLAFVNCDKRVPYQSVYAIVPHSASFSECIGTAVRLGALFTLVNGVAIVLCVRAIHKDKEWPTFHLSVVSCYLTSTCMIFRVVDFNNYVLQPNLHWLLDYATVGDKLFGSAFLGIVLTALTFAPIFFIVHGFRRWTPQTVHAVTA